MMPNAYLFAALLVAGVGALVWVHVVEPRIDARRHPGDQLADEIEAWLQETRRP